MSPTQRLAGLLDVPASRIALLDRHSDADNATLLASVEEAVRRDNEAIQHGLTQALRLVPLPLRGVAKRLLFPGGGHD